MTGALLGVYGYGGCGRGIMPLARKAYPHHGLVFVDDKGGQDSCNGHEVMSFERFSALPDRRIVIAVASPAVRRDMVLKCEDRDVPFFEVMSDDVIRMDDVKWGNGALISPRVTMTSNIRIGAHFHCNLHSYVEHDCVIGDFVTFAPGVRCNGSVTIGDGAYVGCGAMIRQGISIGAGATIGMGAVVIKDVGPGETVVGNPARLITR